MNTLLTLILIIVTSSVLQAQQLPEKKATVPESYWKSEEFQKRFLNTYGSNKEIEPEIPDEQIEIMQAVQELMAEKLDSAATELELLLQDDPDNELSAQFDFILANLFFQTDKNEKAAKWYNSAVGKFPKFRRAWKNLGLVYAKSGQMRKSIKPFTEAIALGENDALTYGLLGTALLQQEDYLSAESAYRTALLFEPETLDYKLGLAQAILRQQKFGEAVALTGELIAKHPEKADFWMMQANAYLGLEQPMKAAENFEILDRMGKATPESLNLLGDIYATLENMGMAANAYARALKADESGKPDPALRAARILAGRAAYSEAKLLISEIKKVAADRLSPEQKKDLLKTESRIALAEGADEEAAKVLQEVVEMDPLDGDALLLLGQHYQRYDEPEKAQMYYERAADLEKFEADASVRLGQLFVSLKKYSEALTHLRRAQEIKPRDNVGQFLEKVERMAKSG
jgi:tetratricopeptide (TPR) repeat protein